MIAVTAATGQLGHLVIKELLKRTEASNIVAAVRTPAKAEVFTRLGIQVREADYTRPETLNAAFRGTSKLLLISGTDLGKRVEQHQAALDAARSVGVDFVAYTSILHCDTSPLILAKEHFATEQAIQQSGLHYSLLRNGWYFENQTAAISQAITNGAFIGASRQGKYAAASRRDYATAAAIVLTQDKHENSVLEFGGDEPYSRTELAAEVSKQSGKPVVYKNLSEAAYREVLSGFLPAHLAQAVADAEAHAANGALDDRSHALSHVLGRPTASLAQAVASALEAPPTAH